MKKRIKNLSKYKQMAFETAIRNPERYINILAFLKDFEGQFLNDESLLKIVSGLYVIGEVSSDRIEITDSTKTGDIKEQVIEVNSTRNADGGFPKGYQSRFWTYVRTLSELGFVYAQYEKKLKLSILAKMLINREIDEQEAFSIQAMKYNRKSPYRNVSNDFNFFRFMLNILLKLRKEKRVLSYEQFIVAMFSPNGNVDEFLSIIRENEYRDYNDAYNFVKNQFDITTRFKTVVQDYPDVVLRLFIISGFITIRYSGRKLIEINENKLEYIQDLLKIKVVLSDKEKQNPVDYFDELNTNTEQFLNIARKYRAVDKIDGITYVNKIWGIIENYKIDKSVILKCIEKIGTKTVVIKEFKEIPDPLKLEFYISILVALRYGKDLAIRPNYKADHIGKPYSHAPGNIGDIEIYSSEIYWLIEVTLIRNKTQQFNSETTSVIRHLFSNEKFKKYLIKYLSFVAPLVHPDTKEFYDISIVKNQREGFKINLKPYSIKDFIEITLKKDNFVDMEAYTNNIISEFKSQFNIQK